MMLAGILLCAVGAIFFWFAERWRDVDESVEELFRR